MDEKIMVCCPVCQGAGKLSVVDEPILKKGWEMITIPLLQEALYMVFAQGLLNDAKKPPSLLRKFILTQEDLVKQKRVHDFTQVAGVLRRLSSTGESNYKLQGTLLINGGGALIITVLFGNQAAVAEGLALFGHPIKPYDEDANNGKG